jgi:hypothetical protein
MERPQNTSDGPAWTLQTLLLAVLASIAGYLLALLLGELDAWPSLLWSEFLFGGICGATLVHRLHPGHAVITLVVFVPTLGALLLAGTFLYYVVILGESI